MWYQENGEKKDVVVSTRVRLARNIVDYPFEPRLNEASAREIIDRLAKVFDEKHGFEKVSFEKKEAAEQLAYAEKHLVSPEFSRKKNPHELFVNEEKSLYIMACEEDHVRIQCVLSGLALEKAYQAACEADDLLDQNVKVAYNEKYGYLTHCPTNLGTGLRASVMMFLPALTMNHQISFLQNQLSKIGLTIRGMSGEGSSAQGCLFQISNQVTLGVSEEETIQKLGDVVKQISDSELKLRNQMRKNNELKLKDKSQRALGTMKYAELMSSEEMISLYADLRLGAAMGYSDIDLWKLDSMLFSCMPATLAAELKKNGGNSVSRDASRAATIKKIIG